MKQFTINLFSYCFLSFFMSLTILNTAQAQVQDEPINKIKRSTNIGVFDPTVVMSKSQKGKSLIKGLEQQQKIARSKVDAQRKGIMDLQNQIRQNSLTISKVELEKLSREYDQKVVDLKQLTDDIQRKMERAQQMAIRKFNNAIKPIVQQISINRQLDLVLIENNDDNIFYVNDRINITDEVVRLLDASE